MLENTVTQSGSQSKRGMQVDSQGRSIRECFGTVSFHHEAIQGPLGSP